MISKAIVKEQLEAYLGQLMPPFVQGQKPAPEVSIDPDAIAKLVEDHMKKLRDLIDSECKKMYVDYARDCNLMIDSMVRCFIGFCQNPEAGFEVERINSSYGNLREMFLEKYRSFFSNEYEDTDSVFFSLSSTLEELKTESSSLHQRLTSSLSIQTEASLQKSTAETTATKETQKSKPAEAEQKQAAGQKAEGGWISRLMNRLKPANDNYIKCKLEESGTGMRYDAVKKRWVFDDDQGDGEEEEKTKAPPKAKDIEEKKEQAKAQQANETEGEKKEESIVDNLLKPRGRNTDRNKGKGKAQNQGPKLPKVTARMFEEINSQAANFTIDQQRELIVFELKEQIRAILSEANSSQDTQNKSQQDVSLYLEELKGHISQFLDTTLARIYSQFKAMHNSFDDSLNDSDLHIPIMVHRPSSKVCFSQGIQTDPSINANCPKLSLEQLSQEDKFSSTIKLLEEEKLLLLRTNSKTSELNQILLRQLTQSLQSEQAPKETQNTEGMVFSEAELDLTVTSLASLVKMVNGLRSQTTSLKAERGRLIQVVRLLLMENEQKGNFIVEMQKKFKARKTMLYTAMKQSEVVSKEKEILKAVAKAFFEESAHYQAECDRLSLEVARMRLEIEKESSSARQVSDHIEQFMSALVAKGRQDQVQESERELAIAARFKSLQTLYSNRIEDFSRIVNDASRRYITLANNVQGSLVSYDNEVQELHEKIASFYDVRRELEGRISKLKVELNTEKNSSENFQNRLKDSQGQLKIKEEEVEQVKQELEDIESELSSKREQITSQSERLENIKAEYDSKITEIQDKLTQEREKLYKVTVSLMFILKPNGFPDFLPDESIEILEEFGKLLQIYVNQKENEITNGYENTQERVKFLEKFVNELETEKENYKMLVEKVTDDSRLQKEAMESKLKEISGAEQSLIEELADLSSKLNKANDHVKATDLSHSQIMTEVLDLKDQLVRVEVEKKENNELIEGIKKQSLELQDEINRLLHEKETLQITHLTSSHQSEPTNLINEQHILIQKEISEEIQILKRELTAEKEAKLEVIKELSDQNDQFKKLSQECESLLAKMLKTEGDIKEKDSKISELLEEIEKLKQPSEEAASQIESDHPIKLNEIELNDTMANITEKHEQKDSSGLREMHEHMEIQNRRIELLLMDIEEANRTISEYRQEREDLKTKVLHELREVAESNKEAKDFLTVLLQGMQK